MSNMIDSLQLSAATPLSFELTQLEERLEMTVIQLPCPVIDTDVIYKCPPPYQICFT
jgi:hypothetical protein